MGLTKVQNSCEKIQHWGAGKDETGNKDVEDDDALKSIEKVMPVMRKDYDDIVDWLKDYYKEDEAEKSDDKDGSGE